MARSRTPVRPESPNGWVGICDRELRDVGAALKGRGSNSAVIYHALQAVEAILKALIWARYEWSEWPKGSGEHRYLYQHDLGRMLEETGLEGLLLANLERYASWQTIINEAEKQHRYSEHEATDVVAWAVAKAVRDLDKGVVPWLKNKFHEMT